jgi:hypothetical protein
MGAELGQPTSYTVVLMDAELVLAAARRTDIGCRELA